jgi:hypothetical protein
MGGRSLPDARMLDLLRQMGFNTGQIRGGPVGQFTGQGAPRFTGNFGRGGQDRGWSDAHQRMQDLVNANVAQNPSMRDAAFMAGMVASPVSTLAGQMLKLGAEKLGVLDPNSLLGAAFSTSGPRLTPEALQSVMQVGMQAFQSTNSIPLAQAHALAQLSVERATARQSEMGMFGGPNFADPGFSISRTGSSPLGGMGGGGDMGGGSGMGGAPDTGGGMGGGVGGAGGGIGAR